MSNSVVKLSPKTLSILPSVPSLKELLGARYTEDMAEVYPDAIPGLLPVGYMLLCQIASPGKKIKLANGKIIWMSDETQDANKYNSQTAVVRAMGPVAFKTRDTMIAWPEGSWCTPGMFIRTPLYGGDRFVVKHGSEGGQATFILIKDLDVIGLITGDPLATKVLA